MSKNKTITNIVRKGTENGASVLRRFSKRMRDMGIVREIKDQRYHSRLLSPLKMKEQALRRIEKIKEVELLKKLGKMK